MKMKVGIFFWQSCSMSIMEDGALTHDKYINKYAGTFLGQVFKPMTFGMQGKCSIIELQPPMTMPSNKD